MASHSPENYGSYSGPGAYYGKQTDSTYYSQNCRLPSNLTIPSSDFHPEDATLVPQSDFDAFCSDIPQVDSDFDPSYLNIAEYQSSTYTFPDQSLLNYQQRYDYDSRPVSRSQYTFAPARNLTHYPSQIPDDLASDLPSHLPSDLPSDAPSELSRSLPANLPAALAPSIAGPLTSKPGLMTSDIPSSPPSSPSRLAGSAYASIIPTTSQSPGRQPPPRLRLARSFRSDVERIPSTLSTSPTKGSSPIRMAPQGQRCDSLGIRYSPTHRPRSTVIGNESDATAVIPTLGSTNTDPEVSNASPVAPTHFPHKSPHFAPPVPNHAKSPHAITKSFTAAHSHHHPGLNYGPIAHHKPAPNSSIPASSPTLPHFHDKMGPSVAATRMALPPGAYEAYALSPTLSEVSISADDNEYPAPERSPFPSSPVEDASAAAKISAQVRQPYLHSHHDHQDGHDCHDHCHHPHSHSDTGNYSPDAQQSSDIHGTAQDYKGTEFVPAAAGYPQELRWYSTVGPSVSIVDPVEDQRRKCKRLSQLPYGVVDEFIGVTSDPHVYRCLYSNCGRLFKRTYNLRSHIQTHLCDRPYTCRLCNATFVRPHDLRRHERCHSLTKPYLCPCGKGFNRQDALQRHRTRNICAGGIPSDDPKPKKPRGRPRTRRPEGNNGQSQPQPHSNW